jgi:HK97 gp10 family phage protein
MATLDNLAELIMDEVSSYTDEVIKALEAKLDETADKILEYIKNNAPRSGQKNGLADDFVKADVGSGVNKTIVIYGKEKGMLVHLIEFGFMHRSGKYVNPRPFLRPAYDTFTPKMLEDIKVIIRGK